MKKITLVLILLAIVYPAAAECANHNTPKISVPDEFELSEGKSFFHDIYSTVIDNRTNYTFNHISSTFESFEINNKGIISLTPTQEDTGEHKIIIIGYADNNCHDSKLVTFKVNDRPEILSTPKEEAIETIEGKAITFKIYIDDSDDQKHDITWFIDNTSVSKNKTYVYFPAYNSSGKKQIKVVVRDSKGLTDENSWVMSINNVNRPPVLVNNIPSFALLMNRSKNLYDLTDYFKDPDGDEITFSYKEIPFQDDTPLPIVDFDIVFNEGIITIYSYSKPGYKYYKWVATDPFGLSTESNNIKLETLRSSIYTVSGYCGDTLCSPAETCSLCPRDCGPCDKTCNPDWKCQAWETCLPSSIQKRVCEDKQECNYNWGWPPTAQACIYEPTCFDDIKNQDEKEVDCGGSCGPCPSCEDGIKNFGEEKIDCGGICDPCDSCFDNLKNQDESDVDCGGSCGECSAGKSCNNNFECTSFICLNGICTEPNCEDGIQNQNEEKTDCGGPCPVCHTCSDGIQNQNEEKIDCGGPCDACPTCEDEIKNQGETLVDCGGPCATCTLSDYLKQAEYKQLFFGFLALLVLLIIGLKYFKDSMFYFDLKTSGLFSFLESNKNLSLVIFLNRFIRLFHRPVHKDVADEAIEGLKGSDKVAMGKILKAYFRHILAVSAEPNYDEIYTSIKRSNYRFLIRALLIILLKNMGRLNSIVLGEELKRIRHESTLILKELGKSI